MTNKQHTKETRLKISLALRGRHPKNVVAGWNKGKSSWAKGKELSEEHKRKIGESNRESYKSEERRRAVSERMKGEKNRWWRGGITHKNYTERQKFMNSFEYRNWRKAVFERDNYTCQNIFCGKRGGYLEAHHIRSYAEHPELRLEISNGVTLCRSCHKREGRPKKEYAEVIKILSELL